MTDFTPTKGDRVVVDWMPGFVYIVEHVSDRKKRFYAVSEDGMSGRSFDFADARIAPPDSTTR